MNAGEIIFYQTEDGESRIDVRLVNETVWLSAGQMVDLFQRDKSTISRHIQNVFEEGELPREGTVAFFATVQNEGGREVTREIEHFSLDIVISVGYRVKSHRGTQFRIWATRQLRDFSGHREAQGTRVHGKGPLEASETSPPERGRNLMTSSLNSLTALRDEWTAAQPLRPEDAARLWKKLRLEWNYHSNHIEGNTLTYGETELLLLHDRTTGNHTLREYEEMKAHDVAIDHVRELAAADRVLTEGGIRDLNQIILKEPFWTNAITADGQPTRKQIIPGQYKTTPNVVRTATGELFPYASVEDTPPRMAALAAWLREELEVPRLHPVEIAARLHHDFVVIHPFDDGNGRVARLLVNYVLMRHGYLPVIVPTGQKAEYLNVLGLADAGDLEPMTRYLARLAEGSIQLGLRASRGESIAEADDLEKELAIFIRNQRRDDGEVIPRSPEVLRELCEQGLEALVGRVLERVEKLAPLFSSAKISFRPSAPEAPKDLHMALQRVSQVTTGTPSLKIEFRFYGYTGKAPEPFDLRIDFVLRFEPFQYLATSDSRPLLRKLYSEPVLTDDIESISAAVLASAFAAVKKLSGVKE